MKHKSGSIGFYSEAMVCIDSDPGRAYRLLKKAHKDRPRSKDIVSALFKLCLKLNKYDMAEKLAGEAVKRFNNTFYFKRLAQLLVTAGEYDVAEQMVRNITEKYKDILGADSDLLAYILVYMNKLDEAEVLVREHLEIARNRASLELLVRILVFKEEFEEAEDLARERLRLLHNTYGLTLLAEVLRKLGKYEESLRYVSRCVKKNYVSYNCAGYCQMNLGMYKDALKSFLMSLESYSESDIYTIIDGRLRCYVGIIFLSRYVPVPTKPFSMAKNYLLSINKGILGRYQLNDYEKAMKFINE